MLISNFMTLVKNKKIVNKSKIFLENICFKIRRHELM
jgi:hypothetical protein